MPLMALTPMPTCFACPPGVVIGLGVIEVRVTRSEAHQKPEVATLK